MDLFERAHVPKKNVRKDTKTNETVKKQLKQMLEGYKQSDNKLIKNSENIYVHPSKGLLDDSSSSSVSDFSDLILNSSNDSNSTKERLNSDVGVSADNSNEEKECTESQKDDDSITSLVSSIASISETKDIIDSSSDVLQSMDDSTLSDIPDDVSLLSSLLETVTEMDSEESFDTDGALAVKILEKLGKKKIPVKTKIKKSKASVEMENEAKKSIENKIDLKVQNDGRSDEEALESNDIESIYDPSGTDDETDQESDSNSTLNSNMSSPFVSVTATEMPSESLSQILGNYKHSTMKNMPTDIQTMVYPTHDTNLFSTEPMSVDDIEVLSPDNCNQMNNKEFDFTENYDSIGTLNDSTTNDGTENNILQSEQFSEIESTELVEEFPSPVKVYNAKDSYVFVLKHPAELFIHGKVKVRTLGGQVDVFGYNLGDRTCEVYAPNYNYAHCLKTVENQNAYYGLFSKLTSVGLLVYEAEEIVTSIGDCDGVITLSPLRSRQMDFVEDYFNVKDLFSKINQNIENSLRMVSETLGCSLYITKPIKYFEENPSWRQPIKYGLKEKSRGIVCGGKGVGKSTFLRYCINRQLSQGPVLVIDLDPGQAEFTVAGSVSATVVNEPILGPNFTHLRKPEKMLYLGMINTMENPRRYATAVCELITHCHNTERYQDMPWIVNTMGMCNTIGLKFISLIILHTKPTYLLQIDSKTPKKRFECHLNPGMIKCMFNEQFQHDSMFSNVTNSEELDYSFFVCNPMEDSMKKDFSLAARDERYLNYLAYFGQLATSSKLTSLLGIRPYEVDIDKMYIGMNVRVKEDLAFKVINGKVVALCQLLNDNSSRVFILTDKPLLCHGHGLIRAVDYVKGKLYIITPSTELTEVNTLVYADWVPELRGQEKHLPSGATVPYRTAAAYQKRQLMLAPRRRFNPLQLLKMSRSS